MTIGLTSDPVPSRAVLAESLTSDSRAEHERGMSPADGQSSGEPTGRPISFHNTVPSSAFRLCESSLRGGYDVATRRTGRCLDMREERAESTDIGGLASRDIEWVRGYIHPENRPTRDIDGDFHNTVASIDLWSFRLLTQKRSATYCFRANTSIRPLQAGYPLSCDSSVDSIRRHFGHTPTTLSHFTTPLVTVSSGRELEMAQEKDALRGRETVYRRRSMLRVDCESLL